LFYFLTSKILITSSSFPVYLPYRKKQVLINTWHGGGAYKKVGILKSEENSLTYRWGLKKTAQDIDFFISSNKAFTKGISNSFFIKASKFLPYGMPRNDLFFSCSMDKSMIKKKIGVDVSTSIILYAPTFRGKSIQNNYKITNTEINLTDVINTANMKFSKKFVILYRSHYVMENIDLNLDFCKNVTAYPDMQELLYVSDILITDYSSSMWDFSFTFRPGFLFTPDIEEYKNERDFYTPISEWPFPFATTNEQLCENILKFNDEDNINKIRRHHTMLGSYENGDATQRISELILSLTLYETKK
jgi:CDP-glycerol glycerophosphotransferase